MHKTVLNLLSCTSLMCALLVCIGAMPFAYSAENSPENGEEMAAEARRQKQDTIDSEDLLGRETPRGSVVGFLRAVDEGEFAEAARFLDLRNLPEEIRQYSDEELARGLNIVLQRSLWIDLESLSDQPGGVSSDGLPSYRDELGRVTLGDGEMSLYLQRVPGESDDRIWKISNRTIARLQLLYEEYRYPEYVEYLIEVLPQASFIGIELFKWVSGFAIAFIAWLVSIIVAWLVVRSVMERGTPAYDQLWHLLTRPVATLVAVGCAESVIRDLGVGATAMAIAESRTILIILSTWVLLATISMFRDSYAERLRKRERDTSVAVLRPSVDAIKVIVVLIMALVWLDNTGFDITTLLAGLGVGGIAVALVLQKPLEDVFGAFTLFNQQPVRIGDFCIIGDISGTVEEISLRTTRIRTLSGTVISIPNAKLALEPIDNVSIRQRILYRTTIRLSYDTGPATLEQILGQIHALLEGDDRLIKDRLRVRFLGFDDHAFNIEAFVDVDTTVFPEYLAIAEDLNLKILNVVNDAGATFANPASEFLAGGSPV